MNTAPATTPRINYHVSYDELSEIEKGIYRARANMVIPKVRKNYCESFERQDEARRRQYMNEFLDKAKMRMM